MAELAREISARTGSPQLSAECPALRSALANAFPDLPAPESLEGCTTHPALAVRFKAPGLGREAAKVVFVPRGRELEVRLRIEVPAGSYRKETFLKLVSFLESIERALEIARRNGGVQERGADGQP